MDDTIVVAYDCLIAVLGGCVLLQLRHMWPLLRVERKFPVVPPLPSKVIQASSSNDITLCTYAFRFTGTLWTKDGIGATTGPYGLDRGTGLSVCAVMAMLLAVLTAIDPRATRGVWSPGALRWLRSFQAACYYLIVLCVVHRALTVSLRFSVTMLEMTPRALAAAGLGG
ncbi:MAG: hypothetical protein MHM6MM_008978 [Cercozoa sp. M6MM]